MSIHTKRVAIQYQEWHAEISHGMVLRMSDVAVMLLMMQRPLVTFWNKDLRILSWWSRRKVHLFLPSSRIINGPCTRCLDMFGPCSLLALRMPTSAELCWFTRGTALVIFCCPRERQVRAWAEEIQSGAFRWVTSEQLGSKHSQSYINW